jgi:predicted DNA-binding ribbon-helix-helix protein
MQRTQIYFEQTTLHDLKTIAKDANISVSEFIRRVMRKEIKNQKKDNLNNFLETMKPLESFTDVDATEYVQGLRGKSRIIGG